MLALQRWGRRAVTIPLYILLLLLSLAALPMALAATVAVDAIRGSRWALSRSILYFVFYLVCEVSGIIAAAALWLVGLVIPRSRYLDWNFRLQCWWARTLFAGAQRLFGVRLDVKGIDDLGAGPILLFMRHASIADTILPAVLVSSRRGFRLRYVMKRELLWDPCLDIVGNRVPNYFVRRDRGDSPQEIAAVGRLADDLGPNEGVFTCPEGTRFTPERRRRALDHIRRHGDEKLLACAERLRHVLPPRLGGTLALLEVGSGADAVFCAHWGFDGIRGFRDFLAGGLIDQSVEVEFWRVPAEDIPNDRDARVEWICEQWIQVDRWVTRRSEERSSGS
jgi:1-acyl-sn-glycerol-3-phosphate acyltransferase